MIRKSTQSSLPIYDSAENLRLFRRGLGMRQAALAADIGVSQATVSRWERGVTEIDELCVQHSATFDMFHTDEMVLQTDEA